MRSHVRLGLEQLESRDVPSVMSWQPPVGSDLKYGNSNNWYDESFGRPSTREPGTTDEVVFGNAYSAQPCYTYSVTEYCKALTIYSGWSGVLDLSGGTLNVKSGQGDVSEVQSTDFGSISGCICADTSDGKLVVWGGSFNYDAFTWNFHSPNPSTLNVVSVGGADVKVGGGCVDIAANLRAGDPATSATPGNVTFDTVNHSMYDMLEGSVVTVATGGKLTFTDGAYIGDFVVESRGEVHLSGHNTINMQAGFAFSCPSGSFWVDGDGSEIGGDLSVGTVGTSGTEFWMRSTINQKFTLRVDGSLTLADTTFYFNTQEDPAVGDTYDTVLVGGSVSLNGSDISYCYTWGTLGTGTHTAAPIQYTAGATSWSGQFSSYVWSGSDWDYQWVPDYNATNGYLPYGYYLTYQMA